MLVVGAQTETGGHVLLVILQEGNITYLKRRQPASVRLADMELSGPCEAIEIMYVKRRDEKELIALATKGDVAAIIRLLSDTNKLSPDRIVVPGSAQVM